MQALSRTNRRAGGVSFRVARCNQARSNAQADPEADASGSPGFTLLEMLLVLAVLATILTVSWPLLENVYSTRQLKDATERVRVELAGTRIKSVDAGLMYQFRYEPGGRQYAVLPAERDTDSYQSEGLGLTTASAGANHPAFSGRLPEGLTFQPPAEGAVEVETLPQEWLAVLPNGGDLSQVNWAAPIVFFPDGSASAAALDVVDEEGRFIRLIVRELTGTVLVSDVKQEGRR